MKMENMKTSSNFRSSLLAVVVICVALAGCSNMNAREKNTAVGAAVGGVAGAVLTGGSSMGTGSPLPPPGVQECTQFRPSVSAAHELVRTSLLVRAEPLL